MNGTQYKRKDEPGDLTAFARIRNAALDGFAQDGFAATSIRSVANDAGVSPGLVQHHFPTKDALRAAVDEHVLATATSYFAGPYEASGPDVIEQLGDRVTAHVRDHPSAMRYVARSAVDGDEAGLRVFEAFVGVSEAQWRRLADEGLLRRDVDLPWAALHVTVLNLATVLLEDAISRHLSEPFFSPEGLERWKAASTALFRQGVYRNNP